MMPLSLSIETQALQVPMLTQHDAENVAIVVPCFNEADRLDRQAFIDFARANTAFHFVFVNDGSTDNTQEVLCSLRSSSGIRQVAILHLEENSGKAEATRQGILFAQEEIFAEPRGIRFIGYLDADLATPLSELVTMHQRILAAPRIKAVIGSRLKLAGRSIDRTARRRFIGMVFATLTNLFFRLRLRDTQCGAKLFRNERWLSEIFAKPFHDRWLFDVEMFIRMRKLFRTDLHEVVYEQPLERWVDAEGSRLKAKDFLLGPFKLASLFFRYIGPGQYTDIPVDNTTAQPETHSGATTSRRAA
ncbi:glycosyltransferase [Bremerella sp. T1]|uniref:glycosyltransferase n=1 Tax=Bremerella sp. TYQ1 TaxID=3119568 RepID=UPI001CCC02D9|nr:glycosyltransferase [Bremerella volcania]UBM33772.1 glycosyltransferase [Bremerella volcania]